MKYEIQKSFRMKDFLIPLLLNLAKNVFFVAYFGGKVLSSSSCPNKFPQVFGGWWLEKLKIRLSQLANISATKARKF